jgi:hypothetical protein
MSEELRSKLCLEPAGADQKPTCKYVSFNLPVMLLSYCFETLGVKESASDDSRYIPQIFYQ